MNNFINLLKTKEKRKCFLDVNKVINKDMWITYNKLWKTRKKIYLNIFLYRKTKINSLLTTLSISTWSIIFIYNERNKNFNHN